MSALERARLYLRVARAEGLRATWERVLDRADERRRRRRFRAVSEQAWARAAVAEALRPPVLNVLPTPPGVRFGGVQVQFLARLAVEERQRACALLVPDGAGYRLELWDATRAFALHLDANTDTASRRSGGGGEVCAAAHARGCADVLRRALALSGATALHVENAAGLPFEGLARVAESGVPTILSLHDFTPFCPRPLLAERPAGRFCGYSRDAARCNACLDAPPRPDPLPRAGGEGEAVAAVNGTEPERRIEPWRQAGARLVRAARALVFPSPFLRARFEELLAVPRHVERAVIAPVVGGASTRLSIQASPPPRATSTTLHVAFVGAARPEKGSAVFDELLAKLGGRTCSPSKRTSSAGGGGAMSMATRPEMRGHPQPALPPGGEGRGEGARLRFSTYGGGPVETLERWRRRGVRVCGYYRAGSLTQRLRADAVDVALLLSIGPESYGLTLDECVAARVPVVVFDVGAPAERVRAWNAGHIVALEDGAAGVAAVLDEWRDGGVAPAGTVTAALPAPESAALAYLGLYRRLRLGA